MKGKQNSQQQNQNAFFSPLSGVVKLFKLGNRMPGVPRSGPSTVGPVSGIRSMDFGTQFDRRVDWCSDWCSDWCFDWCSDWCFDWWCFGMDSFIGP